MTNYPHLNLCETNLRSLDDMAVLGGRSPVQDGTMVLGGEAAVKREEEVKKQAFLNLIETNPQKAIASSEGKEVLKELIALVTNIRKTSQFVTLSDSIRLVAEHHNYWRVNLVDWLPNRSHQHYAGRIYLDEACYKPCRCEKRFRDRVCRELLELVVKRIFFKYEYQKLLKELNYRFHSIEDRLKHFGTVVELRGTPLGDNTVTLEEKLDLDVYLFRTSIKYTRELMRKIKEHEEHKPYSN